MEKPAFDAACATQGGREPTSALANTAYRQVKVAILTCRLRPGAMVFAAELAERLQMSPTPVHEALKALCREGLMHVKPRRGYVVSELSERDIKENFELRLMLEVPAARLAAERASTEAIAALTAQNDGARRRVAAGPQSDPLTFLEAVNAGNQEFHVGVARMSGNERLERTVAALLEETQRAFHLYGRAPKDPSTSDHHGQILRAITARDPDTAHDAMAAHLHEAQERISFVAKLGIA